MAQSMVLDACGANDITTLLDGEAVYGTGSWFKAHGKKIDIKDIIFTGSYATTVPKKSSPILAETILNQAAVGKTDLMAVLQSKTVVFGGKIAPVAHILQQKIWKILKHTSRKAKASTMAAPIFHEVRRGIGDTPGVLAVSGPPLVADWKKVVRGGFIGETTVFHVPTVTDLIENCMKPIHEFGPQIVAQLDAMAAASKITSEGATHDYSTAIAEMIEAGKAVDTNDDKLFHEVLKR